ncbi:MAG TPA: chorismate-binding protein [Acidimicrobiales bacterium]|nr:chorismate-binding protein [Acidimicrobiales bacterium]
MARLVDQPPLAVVGERLCTDLVDVTADPSCLDGEGFWAVVVPYDEPATFARFATVRPARPWRGPRWQGPPAGAWTTSLDREQFEKGVRAIRSAIEAGDVYQVNLTRQLRAPVAPDADVAALGAALAVGNPAPYAAVVRVPSAGLHVASASPERYLRREGRLVWSSPIKGTAATPDGFLEKDRAENVMIVDLVRNDLGRVCDFGSVCVPALLAVEHHPGLVHLVSTVAGELAGGIGWPELLDATFPPGSITGAPKLAAMDIIRQLEPVPRGVYCGGVGWVDADRGVGELNVAIRTFSIDPDGDDGPVLRFGTGGGITHDSDPAGEWAETELKARTLLSVASA